MFNVIEQSPFRRQQENKLTKQQKSSSRLFPGAEISIFKLCKSSARGGKREFPGARLSRVGLLAIRI